MKENEVEKYEEFLKTLIGDKEEMRMIFSDIFENIVFEKFENTFSELLENEIIEEETKDLMENTGQKGFTNWIFSSYQNNVKEKKK